MSSCLGQTDFKKERTKGFGLEYKDKRTQANNEDNFYLNPDSGIQLNLGRRAGLRKERDEQNKSRLEAVPR